MIERERANFAARCGQSGEKFNEVQDKICRSQPIDGILNKLSERYLNKSGNGIEK